MNTRHPKPPAELVFSPQVPFSWTRRWAMAHSKDRAVGTRRTYRIAGCARGDAELAAAVDYCRVHGATLLLEGE